MVLHDRVTLTVACLFCVSFLPAVLSEQNVNFTTPSSWQNTSATLSSNELEDIIDPILQNASSFLQLEINDRNGSYYGFLLGEVAFGDLVSENIRFRSTIPDELNKTYFEVLNMGSGFVESDLPALLDLGVAATQAFLSYNDTNSLMIAQAVWNTTHAYQLQSGNVTGGHFGNMSIPSSCDTMVGAVLSTLSTNATLSINIGNVGGFLRLSADLYNITGEQSYGDSAQLSLQFLQFYSQNYFNGSATTLVTSIELSGKECTVQTPMSMNTALQPYYWGQVLEGASVMAAYNTSWVPFFNSLVYELTINATWTDASGVFTYDSNDQVYPGATSHFVHGLSKAWSQLDQNDAAAILIQSYIDVQVNSLLNAASKPSQLWYSATWQGPLPTGFDQDALWSALSLLNAAYQLRAASEVVVNSTSIASSQMPNMTPSTQSGPGKGSKSSRPNIALIVGRLIAVVSGVIIVILSAVFCIRRRRRNAAGNLPPESAQVDSITAMSLLTWVPEQPARREKGQMAVMPRNLPRESTVAMLQPSSTRAAILDSSNQPQPEGITPIVNETDSLPRAIAHINRLLANMPPDFGANEDEDAPPPSYAPEVGFH